MFTIPQIIPSANIPLPQTSETNKEKLFPTRQNQSPTTLFPFPHPALSVDFLAAPYTASPITATKIYGGINLNDLARLRHWA